MNYFKGKMKGLLIGAVVGELLSLYYRDDKFRKKLQKTDDWLEKAKIAFNSLVEVNAKFFNDLKSYDYASKAQELKTQYYQQLESLSAKLDELKGQLDSLSVDAIKEKVDVLKDKLAQIKESIEQNSSNLGDIEPLKKMMAKMQRTLT